MTEKKKNSKWVDAGPKGIFRIDEVKVAKPFVKGGPISGRRGGVKPGHGLRTA